MIRFGTLAVRAANALRRTYLPSYAGLRILLGNLPDCRCEHIFSAMKRKLQCRTQWRYQTHVVTKVARFPGKPEYRDWLSASPLTCLAEVSILSALSHLGPFRPHPRCYSYLWASDSSGHTYKHYWSGFERRNRCISDLLSRSSRRVAVVTDIRSFYPSVEGTRAFQLFEGRAATGIQDEGLRRATLAFAKHQLDSSPRGIPIGTELSHLLASVSTGPLDDALAHAFGERYFRYVDDLVVVCDRSQAERVQSRIREILDGEGLEMNAEKTDVMSKEDWSRSPYDDPQSEIARFSALMRDVAVFLTMRPRSYCDLVKASVDRGLTLPLMRLKSNASYGRFRLFVGSYRQLLTRLRVRLGGIKAIVACACELRERMMEGLRYLAGSHAGQNKVLRRWRTQRARALATRLFYLLPVREYDRIDCTLSTLEDVGDLRALACAVRSGDVGNIVACPGPLVSALAELLVESGVASVRVEEQAPGSPEREEGLRTLRLMGVAVQNTETTGVGAKCTEWLSVKWPRQFDQVISFNDELASICGDDVGYREVAELLRTRLEDRESVALAAVRLSSLSYS